MVPQMKLEEEEKVAPGANESEEKTEDSPVQEELVENSEAIKEQDENLGKSSCSDVSPEGRKKHQQLQHRPVMYL